MTQQKRLAATVAASQRRVGRHVFPTPKLRAGLPAPRKPCNVETVAFCPPSIGDTAGALQTLTGDEAARRADLVIVERAVSLCECRSKTWALSLLYIVALGKTVLVRSAWRAANAKVKRVSASSFIKHVPLSQQRVSFALTAEFVRDCAELQGALETIARTPTSKWCVLARGAPKRGASTLVNIPSGQALGEWLVKHRRVKNVGQLLLQ